MELELRQEQQLSMRQLHSLRLLQMGRLEIREYLESVAQENPTVELELPHEEEPLTRQAERWLDRWRWLEENDRQNSYYERPNGIEVKVHPMLIPNNHPLANVNDPLFQCPKAW